MVNVSWTRRKRRLILEVRLEEEVVEVRAESPLLARSPKVDLRRTTQVIRRAALDRRVGGLILRLAHPEVGWAKAASLARAIRVFRSAGKPVVGFLEGAGNLDYVSYVKRPRLRELLTWGLPWPSSSDSLAGTPLSALIELLTPLLSEEALFLMPWILRIK